jgi:hypothetical protein
MPVAEPAFRVRPKYMLDMVRVRPRRKKDKIFFLRVRGNLGEE